MADDNDTKKVAIPVDKTEGADLNRPFPSPDLDYNTLQSVSQDNGADLPYEVQEPKNGIEAVSIQGARNRFFNRASKTNKYQPDTSQALASERGFTPDSTNLDFPSTSTVRLGALMKKGLPGRRTTDQSPGGKSDLKEIYDLMDQNTEFDAVVPHARDFNADNTSAQGGPASSNDPLSTQIQHGVLSQNRFSVIGTDNKPNIFRGHETNIDDQVFTTLQPQLGAYNPASPSRLTMDELKNVSTEMIKRVVEKSGPTGGNASSEFSKVTSNYTSAYESSTNENIDIKAGTKGSRGAFTETGTIDSYGNMNSPDNKFDGMNSITAINTALSLIAATVAIINEKVKNSAGKTPQGAKPTRNDFNKAVNRGIEIFTGMNLKGAVSNSAQIISAQEGSQVSQINIKENPGFYTVFARSIIRDSIDITSQFNDDIPGGSSSNTQGANNLLEALYGSKTMSAINVFSAIGDIALDQEKGIYDINRIRGSLAGFLDLASAASHKSKRDSSNVVFGDSTDMPNPNDRRLAWRGSSTPSLFLLPSSVEFAHTNTGQSSLISTAHSNLQSTTIVKSKKISKEDVIRHERRLDAEYMPFYFQDLRTNEIVSFHAFLSQLDETYRPSYSDSRMVGRADPVRIYQNTSRDINLRFILTATSREDFNEMWMKFNKMITLLYPQYSKGRTVKNANGSKIVMPFSQVMSASPMIRLRVGDVIRSNYSRFNLGRLFGAGTKDFNPGKIALAEQFSSTHSIDLFSSPKVADALLESLLSVNKSWMEFPALAGAANFVDALKVIVLGARTRPTSENDHVKGLTFGDVVRIPYPEVRSLKKADVTDQFISISATPGADKADTFYLPYRDVYARVLGKVTVDGSVKYKVALFADASIFTPLAGTVGNIYLLDHGDMQVFASGLILAKAALLGLKGFTGAVSAKIPGNGTIAIGAGADYFKRATNFLKPENNAVVRSFEEVGGKGLAGFITNMQMGWINDRIVWETDLDSRAPKTFEVQISFAPIHDIAPGLDHEGYTRAVSYPVEDSSNIVAGDQRRVDEVAQIAKGDFSGARYLLDADYVDETRELGLRQEQSAADEVSLAAMRLLGRAVR